MVHKIGLRLDSLRLPVRKGIERAAELGVGAVQCSAVGELAPENLSTTGRRELRRLVELHGLELCALAFPARHGYNTADELEPRIAALSKVLSLSYDLRAPLVTGAIGRVPEDPEHPARKLLAGAMTEIGAHADHVGATFAIETGPESGQTLRRFIDTLPGGNIRASLDPAALLIKGYDPVAAVRELGEYIVHTHARDALRETGGELGREVAPGDGDVNWPEYLGALEEIGYRGWLTIDLRQSMDPARDVARAVAFLRSF